MAHNNWDVEADSEMLSWDTKLSLTLVPHLTLTLTLTMMLNAITSDRVTELSPKQMQCKFKKLVFTDVLIFIYIDEEMHFTAHPKLIDAHNWLSS